MNSFNSCPSIENLSRGEITVSNHDLGQIPEIFEAVLRRAAELKFQKLAGVELVTFHLAEEMDSEVLPPNIRQQVDKVTQAKSHSTLQ